MADNQIMIWAKMMARMQARACVISRISGLSVAECRKLWHSEVGRSSPSGQQPADDNWFLKTPLRRGHAALILMLYAQARKTLPDFAAFPHAYYHYARATAGVADRGSWEFDPAFRRSEDDYVIPFSRAHFLSLIYNDDERADGVRKCKLQIRRCKSCGGAYLAHIEEIGRKCGCCVPKVSN